MERVDCLLLEPPPTPGCIAPALPCAPSCTAVCACVDAALGEASPLRNASPARGECYLVADADAPQPLADGVASSRPARKRTRVVLSDALLYDDDSGDDAPVHETQSCASPKKYRGVWLDKKRNKFKTRIWVSGRTLFLGSHTLEDEAARAYDQVAISRGGPTAFTNFPADSYDIEGLMATPLPSLVAQLRGQASRTRVEMQTSRHRGVCRHKQTGKWSARIQDRGKKIFLGLFDTEAEAAEAFDEEAAHLAGHDAYASASGIDLDFPRTPRTPRRAAAHAARASFSPDSAGAASGSAAATAWASPPLCPSESHDVSAFINAPKKPRSPSGSAWGGSAARGCAAAKLGGVWECGVGGAAVVDACVVQAAHTLLRIYAAATSA